MESFHDCYVFEREVRGEMSEGRGQRAECRGEREEVLEERACSVSTLSGITLGTYCFVLFVSNSGQLNHRF